MRLEKAILILHQFAVSYSVMARFPFDDYANFVGLPEFEDMSDIINVSETTNVKQEDVTSIEFTGRLM